MLEQNDKWAVQRACCMTLESVGQFSANPVSATCHPSRADQLALPQSAATNAVSHTTPWNTIMQSTHSIWAAEFRWPRMVTHGNKPV